MKKFISLLLAIILTVSVCVMPSSSASSFDSTLVLFPSSYKSAITALHKKYPNWVFRAVKVGKEFKTVVAAEHNCRAQLCTVQSVSASNAKACPSSCKYASYHLCGSDRCASYNYIAQCMNPTYYLTESKIYQFEYLCSKSYYTKANLESILSSKYSFMKNKTCTLSGKKYYYSQIILDACKKNNIDALFVISRITKEVGAMYPSSIATGYKYTSDKKTYTVYNFFNIGGSVSGSARYAYNHGWTNPKAALEGGIAFIATNYIKHGQYTDYLQKFQVNPNAVADLYEHQYMQTVDAVIDEASYTYNSYKQLSYISKAHIFYIPVFTSMSGVVLEDPDLTFTGLSYDTQYAYVNDEVSSSLNLRATASSSGTQVGQLSPSTLLYVTSTSGGWRKVKVLNGGYKGKTGWVSSSYVSFCQKACVSKGSTLTLKPKLTSSTCSYSALYSSPSGSSAISAKGVVSGKAVGSAVYKASSSAGAVTFLAVRCSAAGLPAKPKFTLSATYSTAVIQWNKTDSAVCYRIWSYDASTGKYKILATTTALSYKVSGLKGNTEYTYLVRVKNSSGWSPYTTADNKKIRTAPSKPTLKTDKVSDNYISLSWKKVSGASYYRVYSYNPSTKKYKILKQTALTSFKDAALSGGTKNYYLSRAFNTYNAGSSYSASDVVGVTTLPAKPEFKPTAVSEKSVKISWKAVKGASYYRIYSYSNKYSRLADTKALSYTVNNLKANTAYTYLVRAFNSSGKAVGYVKSDNKSVLTAPQKPVVKVSVSGTSVNLSWNKVSGAAFYRVFLYDVKTKKYTHKASVKTCSYTAKNLKKGNEYYYLVRAVNFNGASSSFASSDLKKAAV